MIQQSPNGAVAPTPSQAMNALPGAFNQDRFNMLLERARFLQSQGATEENSSDFAQIMQVIRAYQNQQRRPMFQQGMQQSSASPVQAAAPPQQMQPQQPRPFMAPADPNALAARSLFSQNQLAALKYQILAYKLISKNMPLPANLQQAVFSSLSAEEISSPSTDANVPRPSIEPAAAAAADGGVVPSPSSGSAVPNAATKGPSPASAAKIASPRQQPTAISKTPEYNAYASPYHLLKKPVSSYVHASRLHRQLIPSITPIGIDPQSITDNRERKINECIQDRINQLEKLSGAMVEKLAKRGGGVALTPLKSLIELKSLKLLGRQKKLRQEFVNAVSRSTILATSADRISYRRLKRQTLQEARLTEKLEQQQRIDEEQKRQQKRRQQLQAICDHGQNLLNARRIWQAKQNKLGRAVLQFHQHIEKEEQKKAERISKERIRALRNDDEEAYMKLIDQAKDTRLTQLLRQTDNFLESLTKAVVDQQNDGVHRNDPLIATADNDEDGSKVDYFKVTHRIKEDVYQPRLLVGGTLKDYQLKGLQWMVSLYNNHLNGILADEMGLGKTIQTISLITYLIEKKEQPGPYLIIVPLSTLTNWVLEFDKWAPNVNKIVYKGTPQIRRNLQMEIRAGGFQVLLTTFEYIIKDRPVLSKIKWVHMIVDEGHRMKNTNSKLTLVLRQYYHSRYRLILTGTPLQNNLPELWALLNFILPKIFKSVKTFEEWFNTPFSNQGVQDKIELNEEEQLLIIKRLHKVLRPFLLRRLKKDVEAELPDKVERVIKCKLSALQLKLYQQVKKNGRMLTQSSKDGKTGIKGLNNTIMQLRKICNHPFVFEEVENTVNPSRQTNESLYRVSGKFELLDRVLPKLRETGHRVLIFFQMTQIMSIMEDFMNYRGYPYLRLDGSTKSDDRSSLLQLFNSPGSPYFVFLLSTRAGGLGLNLQAADTVIIFDSDWNPHQDLQAQDRAHRIGQTKEVRIFRLVTQNSIEENILARANYKLDIDGKVIQAGKFDNRSTDEDREAFLRSLLEDKNEEDDELDGDDEMDDEELNEMLKRTDQELVIFNRIDAERNRTETEFYRRRGYRKKPERLIQEDELPEIYRNEELFVEDASPMLVYGRGQRVRDAVRYDDGLTEDQWVNALEDDSVDLEELTSGKISKRRKRTEKFSDEGTPKKRGRPKKGEVDKRSRARKDDELSGPDPIPPHIRQQMTQIFETCYKAVEESVYEDEHSYRQRAALFMDLVSKRDYPLYYTMIKNPIAMKMIKKRIHSPYYKSIAQFRDEFHLMFDNARTFNEEGSIVYQDADEMQKIFDATLAQLCPGGQLPPAPMMQMPNMYGAPPMTHHINPAMITNNHNSANNRALDDDDDDEGFDAQEDDDDEYEDDDYNE